MYGRYMSSTWEKGRGIVAGGDLGGRCWELLVCSEVENLGLQMTPESDAFGTGGSFGRAKSDGACKKGSITMGISVGGYHGYVLTS